MTAVAPTHRRLRMLLAATAAAALLVACEGDSPDLPEPPPGQDGTVEEPDPGTVEEPEVDPEAVDAD
jgi:hypothetical protein